MRRVKIKKKIRYLMLTLLSLGCLIIAVLLFPKEPLESLKIGVVRGEKSEAAYTTFARELEQYLIKEQGNMSVTLHYYENDKELLGALGEEVVQMALTSGIGQAMYGIDHRSVIAAENVIEYEGEYYPYYTSLLLKREYEGEDEFVDLEEPTSLQYCILPSNSLAGYVFIQPYFKEQGLYLKDLENVTKLETYAQGIEMLANGSCDVSVGYLGVLEDYRDIWGELSGSPRSIEADLRIIYVSDKIYSSSVAISKEVQYQKKLRKAILDFLLEHNYSESTYTNYPIIKTHIQEALGGNKK